jgi:drug/metabolite transporter (DMT)-like permease
MSASQFEQFCDYVYKVRVHLLLLLVMLCFSGWHIVGSLALKDGADPLVFATYRECIASVLMFLLVLSDRESMVAILPEDYPRFVFCGFCSFVNVVGTMFTLQYLSATTYAIMQPAIPVFATIVSYACGLEALNLLKCFGIALAVGGAVLIEAWGSDSSSEDSKNLTLGMVLVVCQTFGMANLVVFQKPLVHKYDPAYVTAVYYTIGSALTVIMALGWFSRFKKSDFNFDGALSPWLALIYASIVGTWFCYNAISWCVKRVSPAVATIYNTVQPVGTVLLTFLLFGRPPTLAQALGGVLVALGLMVTVHGRMKEQQDKRESYLRKRARTGSSQPSDHSKSSSIISSVLSQEESYRQGESSSFNHTLDIVYNIGNGEHHLYQQLQPGDDEGEVIYSQEGGLQAAISPIHTNMRPSGVGTAPSPLHNPFLRTDTYPARSTVYSLPGQLQGGANHDDDVYGPDDMER